MNLTIDKTYLTSIYLRENIRPVFDDTQQGMIDALKHTNNHISHKTIDHPEFTKLRNQLAEGGYIKMELKWWNGDIVTAPFTLNGKRFKKNDSFLCASAIAWDLDHR